MFGKKRYIAVIVVSEQDTYSVLRLRRFNVSNPDVRVAKNSTHPIDVSKPTYSKGLKLFYFVDINKGHLTFEKAKSPLNPKIIDMILKQSIVKQLTARLSERMYGSQIVNIVIGLVIGALAGYIVAGFI
jgi:hypothetical protein